MRVTILLLFLFFRLGSCSNETKPVNSIKLDFISPNSLDKLISSISEFPNFTQISMVYLDQDSIYFAGFHIQESGIQQIDNRDSLFEIGSITKVFTSTLLAHLALENKVKITDRLVNYLPVSDRLKEITLMQLSNHTSGFLRLPSNLDMLSNLQNPYKNYDVRLMMEYLTNLDTLINQPGEKYVYSNFGVGVLANVLMQASGLSFEELLQLYIFEPFDMQSSTTNHEKIKNRLVRNRDNNGNFTENWNFDALAGAGAILSSANDLSKFMRAHLFHQIDALTLTRQQTFQVDDDLSLGLAWHIIKSKSGHPIYFHNGATAGYTSCLILDTIQNKGVLLLSNLAAAHPKASRIDELAFMLIED